MSAPWSTKDEWLLFESVAYLDGPGLHIGGELPNIVNEQAQKENAGLISLRIPEGKDATPFVSESYTLKWAVVDGAKDASLAKALLRSIQLNGHLILINSDPLFHGIIKEAKWITKVDKTVDDTHLVVLKKVARKGAGLGKQRSQAEGGDPAESVCVFRFGAIGDLIILTPLIRALEQAGKRVTVVTHTNTKVVLEQNPRLYNLIGQARNVIPNNRLDPYIEYWRGQYGDVINLSESIEGALLKVENRRAFYLPKSQRATPKNYYDATLEAAGIPRVESPKGELFFTERELQSAKDILDHTKFNILWALKGSSWHKLYPTTAPLLTEWLKGKPDVRVLLSGGPDAKPYEFERPPQVMSLVDRYPIREILALTSLVDCVVGPETGVLNAAGCFATPKIMFMSHSKPENLAKYWENVTCLEPEVPCYPCYQLHYSLESCPLVDIMDRAKQKLQYRGPACTVHGKSSGAISADRVMAELDNVYYAWRESRARRGEVLYGAA